MLLDLRGLGQDLHTVRDAGGAGGDELPPDIHEAEPADPDVAQAVEMTEGRDPDPVLLRHLEDRPPRLGHDPSSVDRDRDRLLLIHTVSSLHRSLVWMIGTNSEPSSDLGAELRAPVAVAEEDREDHPAEPAEAASPGRPFAEPPRFIR